MTALLDRLRSGELCLMLAIRGSRTTDVVRIAQATGHSAIMVDLEHSVISLDLAGQLCTAAGDLGLTPFVRIPERDYGCIGRLLDSGAEGIIAPRVETVGTAELISRACRFPPRGQRSQLAMVPHLGMRPTPATSLNPALDGRTIVQALLETPLGIQHAAAIAALDGVDMLGIGANDLTAELGAPGDYADPRLHDAVLTVAKACREHGKPLMLGGIADLSVLGPLIDLGVSPLVMTGTDTEVLYAGAESRAARYTAWWHDRHDRHDRSR